MDENKANPKLEKKILKFINDKQPECDFIDYKSKWHEKKYELIKDIFSFTNTAHDKDCYLIFGVDDNVNLLGLEENDKNRKDQKDITDILNEQIKISGDMIPPINVSTIKHEKFTIDVLTVKNNLNVPVYLSERFDDNAKGKKYGPKSIYPGQIFTREGSRNTPINETATFNQVEALWKKRLGIGRPIMERYTNVIKDVKHWKSNYNEQKYGYSFMYDLDPNFRISLSDDNANRTRAQAFSIDLPYPIVDWNYVNLIYNNTLIRSYLGVSINYTHGLMVIPNKILIDCCDFNSPYFFGCPYFVKGNFNYELNNLLFKTVISDTFNQFNSDYIKSKMNIYKNVFSKTIILFKSEKEKDAFKKYIDNRINTDVKISNEEYNKYKNHVKTVLSTENFNKDDKEIIAKEYVSAILIKNIFNQWKENNHKAN